MTLFQKMLKRVMRYDTHTPRPLFPWLAMLCDHTTVTSIPTNSSLTNIRRRNKPF